LAKIAIVHIIGLVEDECIFNTLSFMKSKLKNRLIGHLDLVIHMFSQHFYTLEKLSQGSIPPHGIVMNLENVWKSNCHKNIKGLENAKKLNTNVSIRQISNVHRLPPELYTNAYIRCNDQRLLNK
jgi:hypothetical protein